MEVFAGLRKGCLAVRLQVPKKPTILQWKSRTLEKQLAP